jgi:hypothetical protein
LRPQQVSARYQSSTAGCSRARGIGRARVQLSAARARLRSGSAVAPECDSCADAFDGGTGGIECRCAHRSGGAATPTCTPEPCAHSWRCAPDTVTKPPSTSCAARTATTRPPSTPRLDEPHAGFLHERRTHAEVTAALEALDNTPPNRGIRQLAGGGPTRPQ